MEVISVSWVNDLRRDTPLIGASAGVLLSDFETPAKATWEVMLSLQVTEGPFHLFQGSTILVSRFKIRQVKNLPNRKSAE